MDRYGPFVFVIIILIIFLGGQYLLARLAAATGLDKEPKKTPKKRAKNAPDVFIIDEKNVLVRPHGSSMAIGMTAKEAVERGYLAKPEKKQEYVARAWRW